MGAVKGRYQIPLGIHRRLGRLTLTPPDEIATTANTAEEQSCGHIAQIEKASNIGVVTVQQDLDLFERDMHRWVWDLRPTPTGDRGPRGAGGGDGGFGDRGGAATALPGMYMVMLPVNGKSYTQPLQVKMDPRLK